MEALSVPAACARASASHDAKTSAKSICTITPAFLLDAPLQRILLARSCMGQRPPVKTSAQKIIPACATLRTLRIHRGVVPNETSRALAVGAGRTLADCGRICDQPRRQDRGGGRGRGIVRRRTPGAGRMRALRALRRDGGAGYGRDRDNGG